MDDNNGSDPEHTFNSSPTEVKWFGYYMHQEEIIVRCNTKKWKLLDEIDIDTIERI
jgi:hypothetical protein